MTETGTETGNNQQGEGRAKVTQLAALLLVAGLISAGTVATVVIAANKLNSGGSFRPEIALPILLVAGLIALVAALAVLVGTFSIFGLSSPGAAFGLPEGTLQAVIAMMIIMIFAITSLYLNASQQTSTFDSTGITQAQLAAIPADEIRQINLRSEKDAAGNPLYDVKRSTANRVAEDFAKQLLTTLSTLVVAVAGFYFGAKSVESGVRTAAKARSQTVLQNADVNAPPPPGGAAAAGTVAPVPPGPGPPDAAGAQTVVGQPSMAGDAPAVTPIAAPADAPLDDMTEPDGDDALVEPPPGPFQDDV